MIKTLRNGKNLIKNANEENKKGAINKLNFLFRIVVNLILRRVEI